MARQIDYKSTEALSSGTAGDPYLRPAFSVGNRLKRLVWNITWLLFYRTSPRPFHAWRSMLLRLFGATMGAHCHFYPGSRVWAPWNLICGEQVTLGDGAEVYNPSPMTFASHAIVSQNGYICGATHDYDDPAFPLLSYRMRLGEYSWICAHANVAPGVNVGDGAVLGLASTATRDMEPWTVYAGSPAVKIKDRKRVYTTSTPSGDEQA
ncbi:MAG TPA: hypothetical protein VGE93_26580 [Bryobacteraceae bacterium]|nr:putative colanic acid biosynthesis acetyltransferase [Acidobacteriaceae bacterium]